MAESRRVFFWLEQNLVWRWIVCIVKDVMY